MTDCDSWVWGSGCKLPSQERLPVSYSKDNKALKDLAPLRCQVIAQTMIPQL